MTKKDFIIVAESLIRTRQAIDITVKNKDQQIGINKYRNLLVTDLCASFRHNNPRFDEQRFREFIK